MAYGEDRETAKMGPASMTDMYREMFNPTREELIAGYERAIKRKEEELEVWREYVRNLKGQTTLTTDCKVST